MDHFTHTRRFYIKKVKPIMTYSRRQRLDILLDYVSDKNVLDLGCAEHEAAVSEKQVWWLHGLIASRAKTLKGIDYDLDAVRNLRSKGYDICVADVESMNLGAQYDVIVAGELFEHLTNHRSFLESVKRHLAKDGILVASMPNANSLNYFIQNLVFGHEVDSWDHTAFFTPTTLSVMLKKCGFSPVKIVLYQPSEIYHHENWLHRISAYLFNKFQQLFCWLRPSTARGLIVVAKSTHRESGDGQPRATIVPGIGSSEIRAQNESKPSQGS